MSQPAELPPKRFADGTALGLIGLAIGCAALVPIAFGKAVSPADLRSAAAFCLLFGGGGQLLAGLIGLANQNLLGGTVFTAFSFNWMMNAWTLWGLAGGSAPGHAVVVATEVLSLALFVPLTIAFGYHAKLLFLFLLDIDAIYVCKVLVAFAGVPAAPAIAWLTVALAGIALYLALALLVNPTVGRVVLPIGGPLFGGGHAPPAAPAPASAAAVEGT